MNDKRKKILRKNPNRQSKSVENLKKLLTYYQEITDTIRSPFIILDKDLCVVTANESFYSTFKVLKAETEGKLIYKLGNNQWDSPELRELLEDILPKNKIFNDFEVTHIFHNIGRKTMLLNARQIDSKHLILLAFEDVTESKKLQTDTTTMTQNLLKQKHNLKAGSDAKDEFVSMASHQLRTPATVVKLYAAMLREGYAGDLKENQITMLNRVISSNDRQLEIIDDLLRVARADDGKVYLKKSNCNVVKLIDDVIEGHIVALDNREQIIIFNKPALSTTAFIDAKLIRMVLENLLDNASKYAHEGSTITVGLEQSRKQTVISMTNNGKGIEKKDQQKLFKKFSRIDNPESLSTSGTGLGLYWAKKIIDLHDGSIDVSSKVNKVTTFKVELPTKATKATPKQNTTF
ncbi:hypothetical protein BH23PAT2_BH23PAT2_08090 [soil metagenome]